MKGTFSFRCPNCGEEHDCEVDVGDHFVDVPDQCESCKRNFLEEFKSKIYRDAEEHVISSAIDSAEMFGTRL